MPDISLTDAEFRQFQVWLYEATGINLNESKKALVAGRLIKRLKYCQLESYGNYFRYITNPAAADELQLALDLLTTNETYFFREPKHFEFLRVNILPNIRPAQPFRVWSAASSSGEEAYSIAMTLAEHLTSTPWDVLGSDISTQVLAAAKAGHYPLQRAKNISHSMLSRYCLKGMGQQAGTFLMGSALKSKVIFSQINLSKPLPNVGEFDVIFLRNVMIYFDQATKAKVVARLVPKLKQGGYFFISHSESLHGVSQELSMVKPSIYQKL